MGNDDVKRSTVTNKAKVNFLSYVIRKEVETLYLGEDFLYTPFDVLVLNTKIELTSYQSKVTGKHVRYIFHLYKDMHTKLLFKDDVDRLPEFNISHDKSAITLGREKKNDEDLAYYPITQFTFALYREPGKAILQAFLPMFILSFFILCTMVSEEPSLSEQLPNLATIFLAYVAFIPTVKASIPSVAYATFTDYTIYAYLFATLSAIGDNIMRRFDMNSKTSFWFFFSITSALIFIPMVITIIYYIDYRMHKKAKDTKHIRKEKESSVGFSSDGWSSPDWAK
jgi:hypothetical protein